MGCGSTGGTRSARRYIVQGVQEVEVKYRTIQGNSRGGIGGLIV